MIRPGRPDDVGELVELWREDARAGRRDGAPRQDWVERVLAGFDWDARSRVVEEAGRLSAAALVASRRMADGVLAAIEMAGAPDAVTPLVAWAAGLSRAAGATAAQVLIGRGRGDHLRSSGFVPVRPWWRMDRPLDREPPPWVAVPGYSLIDGVGVAPGTWSEMHNRTFADHWRFSERTDAELVAGKLPELCLLALDPAGNPAAMALGQVETFTGDRRPQPVGLVTSVGTVPEHRRRGLATWLVVELLHRLRAAGAQTASLHVDGLNHTHAADAYRKLGFVVAFEAEVWEATFP